MNRLTFFKRLFQGAAITKSAPKKKENQNKIFILKGSDLVLAIKRTEHGLNLRRP